MYLLTAQDNPGNSYNWSCVELKKRKNRQQDVETRSVRYTEHKRVLSDIQSPGVSLQTLLRQDRGIYVSFLSQ